MRIQPRQQILDIWRAMLAYSYVDGKWVWGGRRGSNAISDAEQLLCLLYPATEIQGFSLANPDDMADDITAVLTPLGEHARIGATVVEVLEDYVFRHTDPATGQPTFAAGGYLRSTDPDRAVTPLQADIEVVDSYSMSLTLCIASLSFLQAFKGFLGPPTRAQSRELHERIDVLRGKISSRLTAAMVGLVRSFVVNTVKPRTDAGRAMLRMLNQSDAHESRVFAEITTALRSIRERLRGKVRLGQREDTDLDDETQLFECGWSWGIVKGATEVTDIDVGTTLVDRTGIADPRPYLYFTVVALDGINDLNTLRAADLLDAEQIRLADALQLRWDLTQRYWSTVARFGAGRWPLEDIPWQTSDGEESDYFSLVVSAVLMQDLVARTATDNDLTRAVSVFAQLARRGRVISRVTQADPARDLHVPGVVLRLVGTESVDDGPLLAWVAADFATVLMKRTLQAARLSGNVTARDQLISLAESTMDHLERRVLTTGPAVGLWDDVTQVFGGPAPYEPADAPSWYLTERVIECLVAADRTYRQPPLRSPAMVSRSVELLNEAEHLLNREMLDVSDDDTSAHRTELGSIEERLVRARRLVETQPGTAYSLTCEALVKLDELAYARQDATRST